MRGRQGRHGLAGVSLSAFLDMVWAEIYDDVGAMSDRYQYRDIVVKLFLKGEDPHNIWITDSKGKKTRMSANPRQRGTKSELDALRALREQAIELAQARQSEPE